MVKVINLNSGSRGNVTLVQTTECNILIDVGVSMKKINEGLLLSVGIDLENINYVVVTHA